MKLQITGGIVEIDERDSDLVQGRSWYVNEHGYAISRIKGSLVRMHRLITAAKNGEHVDHSNRNGLDNRRDNLRVVRRNQNMWNSVKKDRGGLRETSSKFKGVNRDPRRVKKWVAEVWKFGRKIFTKGFTKEIHAAFAYNVVAVREFGEFALLNNVSISEEEMGLVRAEVASFIPRGKNNGGCVSFCKSWKKWTLRMVREGKMRLVAAFDSREEAETAREQILSRTEGAPV